jgi:hypothetical protein
VFLSELHGVTTQNTVCKNEYENCILPFTEIQKHNRSEMVAVLGPNEALPYYTRIHTEIQQTISLSSTAALIKMNVIELYQSLHLLIHVTLDAIFALKWTYNSFTKWLKESAVTGTVLAYSIKLNFYMKIMTTEYRTRLLALKHTIYFICVF